MKGGGGGNKRWMMLKGRAIYGESMEEGWGKYDEERGKDERDRWWKQK